MQQGDVCIRLEKKPNSSAKMIPVGMQGNEWYIQILSDIIFKHSPMNCTIIYQALQITSNAFELQYSHHSVFSSNATGTLRTKTYMT